MPKILSARTPRRAYELALITALGLVVAVRPASAVVLYDNLKAVTRAEDQVSTQGPFYDSFSNGGGPAHLDGILAVLSSPPGETNPLAQFDFELLKDNGGKPGAVIESSNHSDLDLNQTPTATDTGLGGVVLASDTRYWVEMVTPDLSSLALWGYSLDTTGKGVAGEYFGIDETIFPNAGAGPFQMRVFATPLGVPEPATWAMMALGVGGLGAKLRRKLRISTATVATA